MLVGIIVVALKLASQSESSKVSKSLFQSQIANHGKSSPWINAPKLLSLVKFIPITTMLAAGYMLMIMNLLFPMGIATGMKSNKSTGPLPACPLLAKEPIHCSAERAMYLCEATLRSLRGKCAAPPALRGWPACLAGVTIISCPAESPVDTTLCESSASAWVSCSSAISCDWLSLLNSTAAGPHVVAFLEWVRIVSPSLPPVPPQLDR